MNLRVSEEFGLYFARIPLKSTPHIRHGNALRVDWHDVLPAQRCSHVLGNPPFIGAKFMDDAQREDSRLVFEGIDNSGLLDFVAAWYVKATRYVKSETNCRCAFVSTNSITQGEQVGVLWGWMLSQGIRIQFAHRTFNWSNEARGKAAVHCVILGFGLQDLSHKTIYEYEDIKGTPLAVPAKNINPYLIDGPDVIASASMRPICSVAEIVNGSIPADGGNLILEPEEKDALVKNEPAAEEWLRPYLGGVGFLRNEFRYCLWLKGCQPQVLRAMPEVMTRVRAVQKMRELSDKLATRQKAATPTHFTEDRQPSEGNYLAIPRTSSENRRYLPLGYLPATVIAANDLQLIPNASLFEFGVLSSLMHRAWVDVTAGRLKSDIRYSVKLTYNTFPWPGFAGRALSDKHRTAIEQAAKGVLDARAQFADASLADLYDPLTMPPALLKAHQKLDTAVDAAYQPSGGKKTYASDAERVAFLFELYQSVTSLLPVAATKKTRKSR
jgi:hypothetical protein